MPRKKILNEEKKTHINISINKNLLYRIDKLNIKRSKLIQILLIDYVDKNKDKLL